MYAAEPHAALTLVAQRDIVDCVPIAKPKKLQNHQTELKVIICDCHEAGKMESNILKK